MICSTALSLSLAAPALAGDAITAVVTGGQLSISNPRGGHFEVRNVSGLMQTTETRLETFEITDLTGTGAGWHVTVDASPFESGAHGLERGSLSMSRPLVDAVDTPSAAPAIAPGPYTIDDGTAVQIANANAGDGMGRFTFSASTLTLGLLLGLLRDDDLDLLLVERVVEGVDLRRVEIELVQGECELVGVEPSLRATGLEERASLVGGEHDIRCRCRPFRIAYCSAQDRPFHRVAPTR